MNYLIGLLFYTPMNKLIEKMPLISKSGAQHLLKRISKVRGVESLAKYDKVVTKGLNFVEALNLVKDNPKIRVALNKGYVENGYGVYNYLSNHSENTYDFIVEYKRQEDNVWRLVVEEEIVINPAFMTEEITNKNTWYVIELREELGTPDKLVFDVRNEV